MDTGHAQARIGMHVPRGATELVVSDLLAASDPLVKRIFPQAGEFPRGCGVVHLLVQLGQTAHVATNDARREDGNCRIVVADRPTATLNERAEP